MEQFWIGFSLNKKNWLSRLIAKFTSSRWSHTFLVISEMEDDYLIIEASAAGGVKFNLLSKYTQLNSHDVELYCIPVDNPKLDAFKNRIGDKYGYFQIIGNALARLLRLKTNPFMDDEVCSELVLKWLNSTKLSSIFKDLDLQLASPEDIYRVVSTKPYLFTKINPNLYL